jgi:signal transduction histidine kinase
MERMIRDGKRASQVVQRLRALARKAPMQTAPLDMNEVVDEAVSLIRREVMAHGITPRLEFALDLPPVLGDRIELQQVVINLTINGMQAMESVVDRPRDLVIRSAWHEADEILISVEDSGSGIDPHNINRLFTPFFTTRPAEMGMGLSICRSLIEAHGGRIWASNTAGPGTTFQFTLPLKVTGVL